MARDRGVDWMNLIPAILAFLMLPGGHAYVRECRSMPGGCEMHAERVNYAINGASVAHGVDPRVLYAIMRHESSLLGRSNDVSGGFFGFNYAGAQWRQFRAECGGSAARSGAIRAARAHKPERGNDGPESVTSRETALELHCLDIQADIAASYLRELFMHCGSWDGALSSYQSGKCRSDSGVRYAARVMEIGGALDV